MRGAVKRDRKIPYSRFFGPAALVETLDSIPIKMSMSTPPSKRKKNETDNHMSVASTSTTSTQEQQSSITTLVEITAASSICADEAAQDTTLVEITTASSKCADEASQGMSSVDITGPGTPPRVSHYEPYTSTPRVERFLVDSEESELVDISFISVTSGLAPLIERQPGLAKNLKTIETQTTERRFVENSSQTDANPVDIIVSEIMEGKLDDTAMISICAAVGTFLNSAIYSDTLSLRSKAMDIDWTNNLLVEDFLSSRPIFLISLLRNLVKTSRDHASMDKKRLHGLALAVEQLYFCRNLNFVGPLHASIGMLRWFYSGSKAIIAMDGTSTASCSATSLKTAIQTIADKNANRKPPADVAIDVFADNNQKICKTVRVRENAITPASVVTNVVHLPSNLPSNIQFMSEYSPRKWLDKNDNKTIVSKIRKEDKRLRDEFYSPFRDRVEEQTLQNILMEENVVGKGCPDHVEKKIELDSTNSTGRRICPKCSAEYESLETSCPQCSYNPSTFRDRSQIYGIVPRGFGFSDDKKANSVHPIIGEVLEVNPNSKDTITTVLKEMAKQAGVGGIRQWVRVGFDGVPYRIANDLSVNIMRCSLCNSEFDTSSKKAVQHHAQHCVSRNLDQVFGDILLVTGSGHMEKNLMMAVFSLLKEVMLSDVAMKLGFRSANAVKFIVGCSNHHLTWQLCQILEESVGHELMFQYVKWCRSHAETPSQRGYRQFANEAVNVNYRLLFVLHEHLLIALKCFRCGIRRNNSDYLLAGRQHVAPIMYVGNHYIYQQIIKRDMQIRVEAPPPVAAYVRANESFSVTGDSYRGEGGDYIVEAVNRNIKKTLEPGVPTLPAWQRSARANDALIRNRRSVYDRLTIPDPAEQKSAIFKFALEVQMVRTMIRKTGWIEPQEAKTMTSISGKPLHPDVLDFYSIAAGNYDRYLSNPEAEMQPIFVTEADKAAYQDSANWTVKKIRQEIERYLQLLVDENKQNEFRQIYKKAKKKKKDALLAFYRELSSYVQNLLLEQQLDEDMDLIVDVDVA